MDSQNNKSLGSRRRSGWGMDLYRNRSKGWVGGVCAGFSEHWAVATWVVRLAVLALFIFAGPLAFWSYIAAWILLAPRPNRWDESVEARDVAMEYDEDQHTYRKRTVFKYSDAPGERLRKAQQRLDDALGRVEAMERYVTSRKYDLNREFSRL